MKRVALITGANRGLGLGTARALAKMGYTVIMGSRDSAKGITRTAEIEKEGLDVVFCQLDVADPESIVKAHDAILKGWGRLDALINNAGVMLDTEEAKKHPSGLFHTDRHMLIKTFEINTVGAYQLSEAFMPLMLAQGYGRIVNVSSGLGQLSEMGAGYPAYRLSKTALNAVTRIFAAQGREKNVIVNSVDPGWVKTDMGGAGAPRSLEEGIDSIVWAATLPDGSPTGLVFRDRQPVEW
ncbi:MAG: SDR family oxidoreductase [Parachlamydia sp.]|nr:SDR family oxidoreductase [Parachlamydia sp.]